MPFLVPVDLHPSSARIFLVATPGYKTPKTPNTYACHQYIPVNIWSTIIINTGFPAGFHLLGGGGVEGLWGGGGSSLEVGGSGWIKIKSVKLLGGVTDFWGGVSPPPNGPETLKYYYKLLLLLYNWIRNQPECHEECHSRIVWNYGIQKTYPSPSVFCLTLFPSVSGWQHLSKIWPVHLYLT